MRTEKDSLGEVNVPKNRLWGAQTERALAYFPIGDDLMPGEMICAYAIVKKCAARVNCDMKRLSKEKADLICQVCDELLEGKHQAEFPIGVWISGSGTSFNMNVNEVIANRCAQIVGKPLGGKDPIHPNDDVNLSQSSNDTFPSAMHIAVVLAIHNRLLPSLDALSASLEVKAQEWKDIIKIGRTHLQDATPMTLGQEFSGYAAQLRSNIRYIQQALEDVYCLTLGGTAVGTGLNTYEGFDTYVAQEIARITHLPFVSAPNKFAAQGAHDALVHLSGAFKTLATALYKIACDIRLLSSGPKAGVHELTLPQNEPGSSIMPGKINPTQCEVLTMISIQVMACDSAITYGNAGGMLEMNVYKPLIIYNLLRAIRLLSGGCKCFRTFCIEGIVPVKERIEKNVLESLMLVTALAPEIGYDKAAHVARMAVEKNLTLKEAALALGYLSSETFDRLVNPRDMIYPAKKKGEGSL